MRKIINWIMGVFGILVFNLQMLADPNTNVTTDPGLSVENKTFYDMTLIDEAAPALVHDQFGQKRPIPKNGGKTIEFRKFAPLAKALTPLTEGVTPQGKSLDVTTITAEVSQYGDFITMSDMLEMTAIDNVVVEPLTLLGHPIMVSAYLDSVVPGSKPVLFGDFSYYWIGERGKRVIKRLVERYANQGQVAFLTSERVDAKLVLPEAIKCLEVKAA